MFLKFKVIFSISVEFCNHRWLPTGFPPFYENQIPWVFPDISLRNLENFRGWISHRRAKRAGKCSKLHFQKSQKEPGTSRSSDSLVGKGIFLSGPLKFPEFSLSLAVFIKFPEFSLSGKTKINFPGFEERLGTLWHVKQMSSTLL